LRTVYLDIATTGLCVEAGARVVEVGMVETKHGMLNDRVFHRYIHPGDVVIEDYAAEVNGYDMRFLRDKQPFKDVADVLIEFLSEAEIVCFSKAFNVGFLTAEFGYIKQSSTKVFSQRVTCIREIAKKEWPKQRNNLPNLLHRYCGVKVNDALSQNTLNTAHAIFRVHQAMLTG